MPANGMSERVDRIDGGAEAGCASGTVTNLGHRMRCQRPWTLVSSRSTSALRISISASMSTRPPRRTARCIEFAYDRLDRRMSDGFTALSGAWPTASGITSSG